MRQVERLKLTFRDCNLGADLKIQNALYYPDSFGNEEADVNYGNLQMHFLYDRGAVYADILVPGHTSSFLNMATVMQRFGFRARSADPVINLRDFFKDHGSRLLSLGDSLLRNEVPRDLVDIVVVQKPGEVIPMERKE